MANEEDLAGPFFPIVDSHIHLFEKSHLTDLRWQRPDHPLHDQHSVSQYDDALLKAPLPPRGKFQGFVFVETDRRTTVAESGQGWDRGIEELEFVSSIASHKAVHGERSESTHEAAPCLAIVGWAPVPGGRSAMETYCERLTGVLGAEAMKRIVGWRYLVQDKQQGTMLTDHFIDSLRWMGEQGYSFDLGIDFRSGGLWQLEEANEMIERAVDDVEGPQRVVIVIDHMGKPSVQGDDIVLQSNGRCPSFQAWSTGVAELANFPNVYMKISGLLSEMNPLPTQIAQEGSNFWERQTLLHTRAQEAAPWIQFVVDTFTTRRCMFGSDWPVCNIGGGGNNVAWKNWVWMVYLNTTSMSRKDQARIWGGTAIEIYKIGRHRRFSK